MTSADPVLTTIPEVPYIAAEDSWLYSYPNVPVETSATVPLVSLSVDFETDETGGDETNWQTIAGSSSNGDDGFSIGTSGHDFGNNAGTINTSGYYWNNSWDIETYGGYTPIDNNGQFVYEFDYYRGSNDAGNSLSFVLSSHETGRNADISNGDRSINFQIDGCLLYTSPSPRD